jgi:hypothetical protein
METQVENFEQTQLHYDVTQPPAHLLSDDSPDQNITLTAALSLAATIQDQADRFHSQERRSKKLDAFASLYNRRDNHAAIQLMTRRYDITLDGSQYIVPHDEDDLHFQVSSHFLDLQICVGRGLGLGAMLPNIAIHHAMEFGLNLHQPMRKFSAKYAKLGFDPTGCMLWIGRSSTGEDVWLAFIPNDCMGPEAEDVPTCSGKEETTLNKEHYRIAVMFLTDMLRRIGLRDIIVTEQYPDVSNDDDFTYATNAL